MNENPSTHQAPARAGRAWITATLAAVGAAMLIMVMGGSAFAASVNLSPSVVSSSTQIDTDTVTDLVVDASYATVTIEFADVEQATLDVKGPGLTNWTMREEAGTLVVASTSTFFGWTWGDDNGFSFPGLHRATAGTAIITLPKSLERRGLDASLDLAGGDVRVNGEYRSLDIEMGAGRLTVDAEARELTLTLAAGSADVRARGVRDADFEMSAGRMTAELTGKAPRRVSVDVAAGTLDLTLPRAAYRVDVDNAVGGVRNRLTTSPRSNNVIEGDVAVGTLTLNEAR
ncbi:hypothetical protein [Microbacterium sp. YY-01]|uniref:hypothetical protein n=1 Tax=Microbacterium sp. YY-01 TaxID=3421634 RepID=UPI003D166E96